MRQQDDNMIPQDNLPSGPFPCAIRCPNQCATFSDFTFHHELMHILTMYVYFVSCTIQMC